MNISYARPFDGGDQYGSLQRESIQTPPNSICLNLGMIRFKLGRQVVLCPRDTDMPIYVSFIFQTEFSKTVNN